MSGMKTNYGSVSRRFQQHLRENEKILGHWWFGQPGIPYAVTWPKLIAFNTICRVRRKADTFFAQDLWDKGWPILTPRSCCELSGCDTYLVLVKHSCNYQPTAADLSRAYVYRVCKKEARTANKGSYFIAQIYMDKAQNMVIDTKRLEANYTAANSPTFFVASLTG
jgi:hypothetical protein